MGGFVPLELFNSFVHPLALAPRMPLLPLMATSTYSALGVLYATVLVYRLWLRLWEAESKDPNQQMAPGTTREGEPSAIHDARATGHGRRRAHGREPDVLERYFLLIVAMIATVLFLCWRAVIEALRR